MLVCVWDVSVLKCEFIIYIAKSNIEMLNEYYIYLADMHDHLLFHCLVHTSLHKLGQVPKYPELYTRFYQFFMWVRRVLIIIFFFVCDWGREEKWMKICAQKKIPRKREKREKKLFVLCLDYEKLKRKILMFFIFWWHWFIESKKK